VAALEPERFLGLRASFDLRTGRWFDPAGPPPPFSTDSLWGFLLQPLPDGRTRLVVSGYWAFRPRWLQPLMRILFLDLEHWIMQTRQFANLRRLAAGDAPHPDPAEHSAVMRLFYRGWRPTRLGRWVNRVQGWWSGLGLPPKIQAVLEVRGRASGRIRSNPVAIATVAGKRYLVSMLGPRSDWVKNVEAAHGAAVLRQGRRRRVHLVPVPPEQRAPVLREYVRIAPSGRRHFPLPVGAPLPAFAAIAERYPVYRIEPV
jgi:deazaflavin-dependent oxidoreductase (nitroreductase family)